MCMYLDMKMVDSANYVIKIWGSRHSKNDLFKLESKNLSVGLDDVHKIIAKSVFLYLSKATERNSMFVVEKVKLDDEKLKNHIGYGREAITYIMEKYKIECDKVRMHDEYNYSYYYVMIAALEAILETNFVEIV